MTETAAAQSRFFRPFSKILAHRPNTPVQSYFSGVFYEFEEPAAWDVTWDLPAYIDLCQKVGARSVLDAGCGSGRIISALSQHNPNLRLTGIDNSKEAAARFDDRCGSVAEFIEGDLLEASVWPKNQVDLALLGNVTINSFTSASAAGTVIRNLRGTVRPNGHVLIVAFQESSLERFVQLREVSDAVPFQDRNGTWRLIWRGVDYDAGTQLLRHNYFIEARDGDGHAFPGILGFHEERVWTADEVRRMADKSGLSLADRITVHVEGGGAQGWPVDALLFRKYT